MTTESNAAVFSSLYYADSGDAIGLSKREYFAALAMQGMVGLETNYKRLSAEIAQAAVIQADALIAALNGEAE